MTFVMRLVTALIVITAASANAAWAGTPDVSKPDDRYKGYPKSLYSFPPTLPDMAKCIAGEYYEPADFHLVKYAKRVEVAGYRIQPTDECTWMRTSAGDRYVRRPKGTIVAQDAMGRDLFDVGSQLKGGCWNPRPFSVPITSAMSEPVETITEAEEPPPILPIPRAPRLRIPEESVPREPPPQPPFRPTPEREKRIKGGTVILIVGTIVGGTVAAWLLGGDDAVDKGVDPGTGRRPTTAPVAAGFRFSFKFGR